MTEPAQVQPSVTCPRCGMTSYHPDDICEGYCGNCHDWTVEADGYRLVINNGAMTGLAYDECPWLWGDPRYDETTRGSWMTDGPFAGSRTVELAEWETRPVAEPPPDLPWKYFGMCHD